MPLSEKYGPELERGMAAHSSTLAGRVPGPEGPGGLQSMGSQSRARLSEVPVGRRPRECARGLGLGAA